MMEKEQEVDRVFDDFQEALSSEQLANALRLIKEHLEKKIPLDGSKIVRHFETFCQGVSL